MPQKVRECSLFIGHGRGEGELKRDIVKCSGVTRALIGGGGGGECEYSYIRVLPDEFLLK